MRRPRRCYWYAPTTTAWRRRRHPLPYRTIIVPLDGSPVAEQALDLAYDVATATGASLLLLAVTPEPDEFLAAEVGDIPVWMLEDRMAETERLLAYLQRQAARLMNAGLTVEIQVVAGIRPWRSWTVPPKRARI